MPATVRAGLFGNAQSRQIDKTDRGLRGSLVAFACAGRIPLPEISGRTGERSTTEGAGR